MRSGLDVPTPPVTGNTGTPLGLGGTSARLTEATSNFWTGWARRAGMFVMPRIAGIAMAPVTPTMYFIRECRSPGRRSICGLYARDTRRVTSVGRLQDTSTVAVRAGESDVRFSE